MPDKARILIIDDDRKIVQAVAIRLKAAGYEPLCAHDGREGLRTAIEQQPDATVLDIRMPGMDGFEVLAELRGRHETLNMPVIVLSASVVDHKLALERGAKFFLEKPYDPRRLLAVIDQATTPTPIRS